jgi:UDP-N-acetylglucosamine 2-epimerase
MLMLERDARLILTDWGGVRKEAVSHHVPWVMLREETEWTETAAAGWKTVVGASTERIVALARGFPYRCSAL